MRLAEQSMKRMFTRQMPKKCCLLRPSPNRGARPRKLLLKQALVVDESMAMASSSTH